MINDVGMPEVAGFRANRAHPPGEGAGRSSEFLACNIFFSFCCGEREDVTYDNAGP
jgi:hypothetical protein